MLEKLDVKEYYKRVALRIKFSDAKLFNDIKSLFKIKNDIDLEDKMLHIHYEVNNEEKEKLNQMLLVIEDSCANDYQSLNLIKKARTNISKVKESTDSNGWKKIDNIYNNQVSTLSSKFTLFSEKTKTSTIDQKVISEMISKYDCYQIKIGEENYSIPKKFVDSKLKLLEMSELERIRKGCFELYSDAAIIALITNKSNLQKALKEAESDIASSDVLNKYGGCEGYGYFQTLQLTQYIDILKKIIHATTPDGRVEMLHELTNESTLAI